MCALIAHYCLACTVSRTFNKEDELNHSIELELELNQCSLIKSKQSLKDDTDVQEIGRCK